MNQRSTMVTRGTFLRLFFMIFLLGCSKDDGKISFNLVQLNDVYEIAPIQGGLYGGLARVKTVHKELLTKNKNTLLVMAGDFLNPSLLGTMKHEGDRIRGKHMIEVMNAMDFDVAAFGNHEFDLSEKELQKRMNESNFPWISANIYHKTSERIQPFSQQLNGVKTPIKGSFIKEISDMDGTKVKIGFVSVCIPSNPRDYVLYKEIFSSVEKEYLSIKNKVDIVFGLTHVTLDQDKKIAQLLPNIPLIMGGHEHTNKNETIGSVRLTKADANAKTVYIHQVDFDKRDKTLEVTSQLKLIDDSIFEEAKVQSVVNKWVSVMDAQISKIVDQPYNTIYHTKIPLDGRDVSVRSLQTNLGKMIAASMEFSFDNQVDCSIVNGGSIRIDDHLIGNINSVDIFRVLPFGGGILKVRMKGNLLKKVVEYGERASGTGAYLQRGSIELLKNNLKIGDQPIVLTKIYTVAISDYLMKGFDIPFLTKDHPDIVSVDDASQNSDLSRDIRRAMIAYLKSI